MRFVIQGEDYVAGILNRYVSFIYTYVQNLPQKLFCSLKKFLRYNKRFQIYGYRSGHWNYCGRMHKYFNVAATNKNNQRKKDGDISYFMFGISLIGTGLISGSIQLKKGNY